MTYRGKNEEGIDSTNSVHKHVSSDLSDFKLCVMNQRIFKIRKNMDDPVFTLNLNSP